MNDAIQNTTINKNYSFTLNGITLTIIIGLFVLGLALIIVYISRLEKKAKYYEKPKYGFLGKPIYPVVVVALLLGSIAVINLSLPQNKVVNIRAEKVVEANITGTIIGVSKEKQIIEFKLEPYVDNSVWGSDTDTFDILWNVRGKESFDMFEFEKSRVNISSFSKLLPKGEYEVKATVIYDGKSYNFQESLSL